MKLVRFEARKIGTKKWKGIFKCNDYDLDNWNEYYDLSKKLPSPYKYVNEVPQEWKFYFTKQGIKEHSELINLLIRNLKRDNCEYRTVEVKNTDKLKKRKCRVLDQHQAVIWKDE